MDCARSSGHSWETQRHWGILTQAEVRTPNRSTHTYFFMQWNPYKEAADPVMNVDRRSFYLWVVQHQDEVKSRRVIYSAMNHAQSLSTQTQRALETYRGFELPHSSIKSLAPFSTYFWVQLVTNLKLSTLKEMDRMHLVLAHQAHLIFLACSFES